MSEGNVGQKRAGEFARAGERRASPDIGTDQAAASPEIAPRLRGDAAAMTARAERLDGTGRAALPDVIVTLPDLRAHLAALMALEPRFDAVASMAGEVPLRRIDPGFKGLVWIVTGQQISTAACRAIFTRCESALGMITAECVAAADEAVLKTAGQSAAKIRTLRAASEAVLAGEVALDRLNEMEAEAAIAHLVAVKGIGRWTAEVYLLFALGHPDVFPAGDLALKEAARLAFALPERPSEKALAAMAVSWGPHRSAAARLLWAYYAAVKRGDATPA
jgi:DNA-3-methyladenine glycosylase II